LTLRSTQELLTEPDWSRFFYRPLSDHEAAAGGTG
jgi:hypothetical protein